MSRTYEEEQFGLKEQRNQLLELIERAESVYENIDNFLPLIRKYTEINELNMQILNELIRKIVVYEKEEHLDGSKSQRVDIHYKFIGYVDINEMLGLPMVTPMAKDINFEEEMKAETR